MRSTVVRHQTVMRSLLVIRKATVGRLLRENIIGNGQCTALAAGGNPFSGTGEYAENETAPGGTFIDFLLYLLRGCCRRNGKIRMRIRRGILVAAGIHSAIWSRSSPPACLTGIEQQLQRPLGFAPVIQTRNGIEPTIRIGIR